MILIISKLGDGHLAPVTSELKSREKNLGFMIRNATRAPPG